MLRISKYYNTTALCYCSILQVPCIVMVEEVDNSNLYIAVSSPDLNFNITRELEIGSQVNGDERFYSISMPVEIQVMQISLPYNPKYLLSPPQSNFLHAASTLSILVSIS